MRRTLFTIGAAAAFLLPAGPALAAPPTGSWCAAGWERWDVTAEPYKMDDAADENSNGTVCARALGEGHSKRRGVTATIYMFADDVWPAS